MRTSLFRCLTEFYASNFPPSMFYDKIPQALKYEICQHESTVKVSLSFQNSNKACSVMQAKARRISEARATAFPERNWD